MKIYPSFDVAEDPHCQSFIRSVEELLDRMALKDTDLPLIEYAPLREGGNAFRISLISAAEFTHGIGRYLSDALSRQFISGKIIDLVAARTLSFHFDPESPKEFVFIERWIKTADPEEAALVQERFPSFVEELRTTLLTVVKTRRFLSHHALSLDDKALFFSENQHLSTFEEMQRIVRRLTEEKAAGEMHSSLSGLFRRRPKIFDRGIFDEMQESLSFFGGKFIGDRSCKYMSRLICTHFYFQKKLASLQEKQPLGHHLLLRFFYSKEKTGILLCMNLLRENEVFKKQHLEEAVSRCLPPLSLVDGSFLMDASHSPRLFFYLEIKSPGEIRTLKNRLPAEIRRSIQRTGNPLFMLRNVEDHMRYLIALSQEIRHGADIPQIAIFFEEQSDESLIFSIILVRVLKRDSAAVKDLLSKIPLQTFLREQRTMGFIGKYPKEASLFQAFLPKREYLRQDHSLDLPKARQKLLLSLETEFRQLRDYNGGFLSKQFELLSELKILLGPLAEDRAFALENFFFSIEPLASQMTLQTGQLREGFLLLLDLLETNQSHRIESSVAGCIASDAKEMQQLRAFLDMARESCPEVSYSLAHYHDILGCILFLPKKSRAIKALFATFFSS